MKHIALFCLEENSKQCNVVKIKKKSGVFNNVTLFKQYVNSCTLLNCSIKCLLSDIVLIVSLQGHTNVLRDIIEYVYDAI